MRAARTAARLSIAQHRVEAHLGEKRRAVGLGAALV
jgi:hypothetical protein